MEWYWWLFSTGFTYGFIVSCKLLNERHWKKLICFLLSDSGIAGHNKWIHIQQVFNERKRGVTEGERRGMKRWERSGSFSHIAPLWHIADISRLKEFILAHNLKFYDQLTLLTSVYVEVEHHDQQKDIRDKIYLVSMALKKKEIEKVQGKYLAFKDTISDLSAWT